MISLDQTKYENTIRYVDGLITPVQIYPNDLVIECDTTLGPIVINLCEIPANFWETTYKLYIVDYANNAFTNNITINAVVGQFINSLASIIINTNGQGVIIRILDNENYIANNNTLAPIINDTGWIDLNGFNYYVGADASSLKPQARRIGNMVHFRGTLNIPIDDGTGAPLAWQYQSAPPVDTYYLSSTVTPATVGLGSVVLAAAGTVTFNQGNSVIPLSIMGVGETFDNSYAMTFVVGTRPIEVNAAPVTSSMLTGLFNISIRSNKTLLLSLPKNAEQNNFSGTAAFDTSHLNYIISHVIAGDNVPEFDNINTNVNSNTGAGTTSLDLEYSAVNIYPFSCNANNEQQVAGFRIALDGLTAFIR